ncbi:hypothetical protein K4L02_00980 [Phaeobacter inhibens]|nr:hypothetical protein [Phaeobacter inhibens]UWR64841.1 hypothetical protein K4L02_00980 [Phaeobacter inhibens]UWS00437.1 hypothetical protein K4L03_00925 [Phaeobacter inhibens]
MTLPTAFDVTSFYLYGSNTTPSNFANEALAATPGGGTILVDVGDYMNSQTGPGRFANASQFELIDHFFSTANFYAENG